MILLKKKTILLNCVNICRLEEGWAFKFNVSGKMDRARILQKSASVIKKKLKNYRRTRCVKLLLKINVDTVCSSE